MIAAMLAESFLRLVEKAARDLDVETLRADVRAFAAKHPDLTTREKAERLVTTAARRAAGRFSAWWRARPDRSCVPASRRLGPPRAARS